MHQHTSLADAFGDVRRDLLQLDDVDRQRRWTLTRITLPRVERTIPQ